MNLDAVNGFKNFLITGNVIVLFYLLNHFLMPIDRLTKVQSYHFKLHWIYTASELIKLLLGGPRIFRTII